MTEAEKAYAAAQKYIEEAIRDGKAMLDFNNEQFRALETLPPEVKNLSGLQVLNLNSTAFTDAGLEALPSFTKLQMLLLSDTAITDQGAQAIAGLTSLRSIHLSNTSITDQGAAVICGTTALFSLNLANTNITDRTIDAVIRNPDIEDLWVDGTRAFDLRPLMSLQHLGKGRRDFFHFHSTSATRADPRIAEIAAIGDNVERASTLFEYLKDWVPPGTPQAAPDQDTYLGVHLNNGKLDVENSEPSPEERDDRVKRSIHDRLTEASATLERAAGNEFTVIANSARCLWSDVNQPFEELDMLAIHMGLEELRSAYDRREQRSEDERLSANVIDALANVLTIGPGLTLDNTDVDTLEDRKSRYDGVSTDAEQAHHALTLAVGADEHNVTDNLRRIEQSVNRLPDTVQLTKGTIQQPLHRNLILVAGGAVATGFLNAAGGDLYAFLLANIDAISLIAKANGEAFFAWFSATISQASEAKSELDKRKIRDALSRAETEENSDGDEVN